MTELFDNISIGGGLSWGPDICVTSEERDICLTDEGKALQLGTGFGRDYLTKVDELSLNYMYTSAAGRLYSPGDAPYINHTGSLSAGMRKRGKAGESGMWTWGFAADVGVTLRKHELRNKNVGGDDDEEGGGGGTLFYSGLTGFFGYELKLSESTALLFLPFVSASTQIGDSDGPASPRRLAGGVKADIVFGLNKPREEQKGMNGFEIFTVIASALIAGLQVYSFVDRMNTVQEARP